MYMKQIFTSAANPIKYTFNRAKSGQVVRYHILISGKMLNFSARFELNSNAQQRPSWFQHLVCTCFPRLISIGLTINISGLRCWRSLTRRWGLGFWLLNRGVSRSRMGWRFWWAVTLLGNRLLMVVCTFICDYDGSWIVGCPLDMLPNWAPGWWAPVIAPDNRPKLWIRRRSASDKSKTKDLGYFTCFQWVIIHQYLGGAWDISLLLFYIHFSNNKSTEWI